MKKTMNRALSVILAVVMLAMAMPIAFAVEPIALSETNVAVWPTTSGEIFYGQKISEGITLSGGVVTTDGTETGTVIPGKFEFIDPEARPTMGIASLKFIPDDTQNYTGFDVEYAWDVMFTISKTEPVLVDENDVPVATKVAEAGKRLATSTLSGGKVKNPYTGEVLEAEWYWVNRRTAVNESGYYEAELAAGNGYDAIQMMVYVGIEGDADETSITTPPSFGELAYTPSVTWGELSLTGGTAVIKGTTTEVAGSFAVTDTWKDRKVSAGEFNIDVKFTPEDETIAMTSATQVAVTVNKAPITFETEDGTGVPTITVDYGRKTNDDMGLLLKQYVPEDVKIQYIDFRDLEGNLLEHANKAYDPGTYTLTCRATTQNKNYAATMLTFNVVINKAKINPKIEGNGNRMIIRDTSNYQYNPKGTFDLYVNDVLVLSDIPYNEYFTYEHTTSGDKNFKAVYDPGDDNRYEIDPITRADGEVKLDWPFSSGDGYSTTYTYGETVTVEAPATDPAKPDKPYYGFAGWNVVEGNPDLTEEELASTTVSFEMPDGGVKLEPTYQFSLKLFFEWIWAQIVQFFTFIINAVKDLIALAAE